VPASLSMRVIAAAALASRSKEDPQAPREHAPGTTGRGHAAVRRKVLIADHVSDFAYETALALGNAGYYVEIVKDGKEVFDKVAAMKPDLLMIRYELRGQFGDKVISALEAAGKRLHIAIYTSAKAVTANHMAVWNILTDHYQKSGLARAIQTDSSAVLVEKANSYF